MASFSLESDRCIQLDNSVLEFLGYIHSKKKIGINTNKICHAVNNVTLRNAILELICVNFQVHSLSSVTSESVDWTPPFIFFFCHFSHLLLTAKILLTNYTLDIPVH